MCLWLTRHGESPVSHLPPSSCIKRCPPWPVASTNVWPSIRSRSCVFRPIRHSWPWRRGSFIRRWIFGLGMGVSKHHGFLVVEAQETPCFYKLGESLWVVFGREGFDVFFFEVQGTWLIIENIFNYQKMNISIPRTKSYMKNSEMIWANDSGQTAAPGREVWIYPPVVYPPEPRMPVTHLNLQFVTGKLHVLPGCDLRLHRIRLESHRSGLGCRSRARGRGLKKVVISASN